MHHRRRYSNKIDFHVWFYGNTTNKEQETARKLVKANGINFDVASYSVDFYPSADKLPSQLIIQKHGISQGVRKSGQGVASL